VGIFVGLATLLMLAGFAYYLYHTAQNKGWFLTKAPYFTYVSSASGLKVGAPVTLMGFNVGEITRITAEEPGKDYNVYVEFIIKEPFYGYVWTDSRIKVLSADLLGNRYLEVTKGGSSGSSGLKATYNLKNGRITEMWVDTGGHYTNYVAGKTIYWLWSDDPPAITERLDKIVSTAEASLPVILSLTNQLYSAINNFMMLSSNLDASIVGMQPIVSNITTVSARLTGGPGALGDMLLPTNLNAELRETFIAARQSLTNLDATLAGARQTMSGADNTLANASQTLLSAKTAVTNTDARLELIVSNLNVSLVQLADITSNLNAQVQANTNLLSQISTAVVSADQLMQGLKKHWLLRSAFKEKTNTVPARPATPSRGSIPKR
jgi:hypothetical protein